MTAPKTSTIRRYCTNAVAISILRERGILTDEEADDLGQRSEAKRDEAYARIYGPKETA